MDYIKGVRYNDDFVKNVPSDILSKLITYDGVIPDEIAYPFYMNNPFFDEERSNFIDTHDYIREQMYRIRGEEKQIYNNEGLTQLLSVESDREISFIRDNPELIPMVDCIELFDANIPDQDVIEVISFEEYVDRFLD